MQLKKKLHENIQANSTILENSNALKFCSDAFMNKKSLVLLVNVVYFSIVLDKIFDILNNKHTIL